jgi:hypothetical protein
LSGFLRTNAHPFQIISPFASVPYSSLPIASLRLSPHQSAVVPHVSGQSDAPFGLEQRYNVISEHFIVTVLVNLKKSGKSGQELSSKTGDATGDETGADVGAFVGEGVGGVGDGFGSIQISLAYTSVEPPSPEHPVTASRPLLC